MRCFPVACAAIVFTAPLAARADVVGFLTVSITQNGRPARDAAVELRGEGGFMRTVRTSATGEAAFSRVPFGRYRATSGDVGRDVEVTSDSVTTIAIELAPREIGRTAATTTRGPGAEPIAVNTIGRDRIATLPQNQSLSRVVETLPGIVRFSYDEPVAHGFHGLTYELDGVPLPLGTTANFSEIVDPRTIDSLEVFTGAFPAEFGGSRQGAVVNIVSHRPAAPLPGRSGHVTAGFGSYGGAQTSLDDVLQFGSTNVFIAGNLERTGRGIDTPTIDPLHDNSNRANEFVRIDQPLGPHDRLDFDLSNDASAFQIPINTVANTFDPIASPDGTDDVQREQNRFFNAVYTHEAADGTGYLRVAPWARYDRVAYDGDLGADVLGTLTDPDTGAQTPLDGLREDRRSSFAGIRLDGLRSIGRHAIKAGIDVSQENFSGSTLIAQPGAANFTDVVAQRGSQSAFYIEDKWTPTAFVALSAGARFDRSTGFVAGGQISPRVELNVATGPRDVLHAYYGRLYAAPFLEDTRREAVVTAGDTTGALPAYDLAPEKDSYIEFGLGHTLAPGARAYVNFWKRDATNVLDTTQIFPTPVFAVFNNAIGIAKGVEGRVETRWAGGDTFDFSASLSQSQAGGISGGTFLFPPDGAGDVTLAPEDHDQAFTATLDYTKKLGRDRSFFLSVSPQYGTGYPVEFESGPDRLPPHLTLDAAFGRTPRAGTGFVATLENLTDNAYLIKVNNGFNTTQYAAKRRLTLRVTQPF